MPRSRAQTPSAPDDVYTIDSSGLDTNVPFGNGVGSAHFPQIRVLFASFQAAVEDGDLQDAQTYPTGDQYDLGQLTPCPDCAAGGQATQRNFGVTASTLQGVGSDGAVMTRFAQLSTTGVDPG